MCFTLTAAPKRKAVLSVADKEKVSVLVLVLGIASSGIHPEKSKNHNNGADQNSRDLSIMASNKGFNSFK